MYRKATQNRQDVENKGLCESESFLYTIIIFISYEVINL